MALYFVEGDVGSGKSYSVVNWLIADFLRSSQRIIYTNLPCDGEQLEWFVTWLSPNPSIQIELRRRIRFLRAGPQMAWEDYWVDGAGTELPWPDNAELEVEYREQGCRRLRRELGFRDGLREFWFHCEPGSVVVLDESADAYNALDRDRPQTLQTFINHHRHYLFDLFFIAQAMDDLDVQVRRKVKNLYYVENMKTKPMFNWWVFKGLNWPIQWFRIKIFYARKVRGRGGDMDRFEPLRSVGIWPSRRGFKNYRSLSAASTLPGLRMPKRGSRSTDLDTWWDRVKGFVEGAWAPAAVGVAMVVGLIMGLKFLYTLAGLDSTEAARLLGGSAKTNAVARSSGPAAAGGRASVPFVVVTNGIKGETNVFTIASNVPPRVVVIERVVLVTSSCIRTTHRIIRPGDVVAGRRVRSILINGVEFSDGSRCTLAEILL